MAFTHPDTRRGLAALAALGLAAASASAAIARPAEAAAAPQVITITAAPDLAAANAVLARGGPDLAFRTSSGHKLTFDRRGDRLIARYARRAPFTLRHDGSGAFVSGDGRVLVRFALDERGDPSTLRMSVPAGWL
jgi:hypothetical protein